MKFYLIPKGENGLPLHPTANVEECMKSYDKIVGKLYTEEEVMNALHSVELRDSKDYSKIYEGMKKWFAENKK